jgi:hypothetical protein
MCFAMFMPHLIPNFTYGVAPSTCTNNLTHFICYALLLLLAGVLCHVHAAPYSQLHVQLAPQRLPAD